MDLRKLQNDPAAFRNALRIDVDGSPVSFGGVCESWQQEDFTALDRSWQMVVKGAADSNTPGRCWCERPRGHSKSSDAMVMATWALFASRRRLQGVVVAGDKDQAALNRNHVEAFIRQNAWLGEFLDCQAFRVRNKHTGSVLDIQSSDVASSWGLLLDFAVLDECSVWPKRDLFDSVLSAIAKKRNAFMLCIMNSGWKDHWAYTVREQVRQDPAWRFSRLEGVHASWITLAALDEQQRLLPPMVYDRLWRNQWTSGRGSALSADVVERAITLDGPSEPDSSFVYSCGMDLSLTRDASAIAICGRHVGSYEERERPIKLDDHRRMLCEAGVLSWPEPEYDIVDEPPTGELKLVHTQVWIPKRGQRVDLQAIEDVVLALHERFNFLLAYDEYQAGLMVQRLEERGVRTRRVSFAGKDASGMATCLLEQFNDGRVQLYNDEQLKSELLGLEIVDRPWGVKLQPERTTTHGDLAIAFSLAVYVSAEASQMVAPVIRRELVTWP